MNVDSLINRVLKNGFQEPAINLSKLYEERLKELGITKHQANQVLGLDKKTIEPILDYSAKSVDIFNLIKIAEFLNIKNFEQLLNSYTSYLPIEKIAELQKVEKACFLVSNFNLEILKKEGFIKGSISDFDEIENRIVKFFSLLNIYDYAAFEVNPAFSRTKKSGKNKMLDFWVKSANYMFKKHNNPYPYDRDFLKDLITKIKPFTLDEDNGLIKVVRALYKAGVTIICQPHLATTQVRGATFIVNEKPCIVLTDLNDRYPSVWFALMHELYHSLFDFDKIKASGFHLSMDEGVEDIFLDEKMEEDANDFARDYFLTDSQIKYIAPYINNPSVIEKYAINNDIHLSLIYAFYCWISYKNGKNVWAFYQKFMPASKPMFNKIKLCLTDFDTIDETENELKNILEPQTI